TEAALSEKPKERNKKIFSSYPLLSLKIIYSFSTFVKLSDIFYLSGNNKTAHKKRLTIKSQVYYTRSGKINEKNYFSFPQLFADRSGTLLVRKEHDCR
ncbi:MAG: hypothetical protein IJS17_05725, partial [Clostridia bacterium]|nr:hypothetical protein [Clostridia bacterium]